VRDGAGGDGVRREEAAREAAALIEAPPAGAAGLVAGFDGFRDRLCDVVATRAGAGARAYERVATIEAFASRVASMAGRSGNAEVVVRREAPGGNGAILALAAATLGVETSFVGTAGEGAVDPLFAALASRARVETLGPPGETDALEFDDGKVMLGRPAALGVITWERVRGSLTGSLGGRILAMGNWTMTAGMTEIWEGLAREALPGVGGRAGGCAGVFLDLADPARRPDGDLLSGIEAMRAMEAHAPVTLGLNLAEAERVAGVAGADAGAIGGDDLGALADGAAALREALGLSGVALHTRRAAALAEAGGAAAVAGPFVRRPAASTGAGDHFNAGVCAGRALGASREAALALGVGVSGLFVRTGRSPDAAETAAFLRELPEPE